MINELDYKFIKATLKINVPDDSDDVFASYFVSFFMVMCIAFILHLSRVFYNKFVY